MEWLLQQQASLVTTIQHGSMWALTLLRLLRQSLIVQVFALYHQKQRFWCGVISVNWQYCQHICLEFLLVRWRLPLDHLLLGHSPSLQIPLVYQTDQMTVLHIVAPEHTLLLAKVIGWNSLRELTLKRIHLFCRVFGLQTILPLLLLLHLLYHCQIIQLQSKLLRSQLSSIHVKLYQFKPQQHQYPTWFNMHCWIILVQFRFRITLKHLTVASQQLTLA